MSPDPLARIEPVALACLLAVAGALTAVSIVTQHISQAIDRATTWGLR